MKKMKASWHHYLDSFSRLKSLFFLLFVVLTSSSLWGQITGTTTVCQNNVYTYSVPEDPDLFYTWVASGGTVVSATATDNEVNILWTGVGTQTLTLSIQPGNLTEQLSVTVLISPEPYLIPTDNLFCSGGEDYDVIKKQTDTKPRVIRLEEIIPPYERALPCVVACENSAVTYTTPLHAGSSYNWQVSGGLVSSNDNNEITVVWGTPGFGTIIVTETNEAGCSIQDNICIEIIDSPDALFSSVPAAIGNTLTICSGQTVYFNDLSVGGTNWAWDFGDAFVSSLQNPDHTYIIPGTYTVTLTVSNFAVGTTLPLIKTVTETGGNGGGVVVENGNGGGSGGGNVDVIDNGPIKQEQPIIFPEADFTCNCTDTYTMTVIVQELPAPIIECISTVCAGDTATYTSPAECTTFDWDVTGGTIVTEAGNSVTVIWGDGNSGPGYITLDVGSCPGYCDGPAVARVSIIPTMVTIDGPTKVCLLSVHKYRIPQVSGMSYDWVVTQGQIMAGQGTNEVVVFWDSNSPGTYSVSVTYGNELLGCGGTSTLDVQGVPEILIMGDKRMCEGATVLANPITAISSVGYDPVSANWSIITPSGTLLSNVQMGSTTLTAYSFNAGPGTYVVIAKPAVPSAFCNDQVEMSVTVVAKPGAPAGIVGENSVCPETAYTYYAQGTISDPLFDWTIVNGGGPSTTATGNSTIVTWGAGVPYELYLTQTYADLPGCTSPATSLIVHDKSLIVLPDITGPTTACLGGFSTYSISPSTLNPDASYQWSIEPTGLGTFLTPENGSVMDISWSTNNQTAATATVKLQILICNKSFERTYTVNLTGYMPGFVSPSPICVDEPAQFFGPSGADAAVYSEWAFGDGNISGAANPMNTYDEPGSYPVSLFVRNASGCEALLYDVVNVSPLPNASITNSGRNSYLIPACAIDPVSSDLYALQNATGTYTYEWFTIGNPTVLGTSNPYTATATGFYYAVVTDSITGCSKISDTLLIASIGCGVGGCELEAHSIDFTSQILIPSCNEMKFTPILSSNVVVYSWDFFDVKTNASIGYSFEDSPTFAFPKAGYYRVFLNVKGPKEGSPTDSTVCGIGKTVFLPIVADFNYEIGCENNSTMTKLIDRSGYFKDGSITSYLWEVSDLANTTSTDANPVLNLASGTYNVTLTITSSAYGVVCSKTETVIVPESPLSVISSLPSGICPGELVQFTSNSTPVYDPKSTPGSIFLYSWNFGPSIAASASPTPQRVITGTEDINVSLTVTNNYGCSNTSMGVLEVNTPENGTITAGGGTTICQGSFVTLTAPAGSNYVWSNGETTQSINASIEAAYTVAVTGTNGCRYTTVAVNVLVVARPNPIVSGTSAVCAGQLVTLITASGMSSYQWYFNSNPMAGQTASSLTFYGDVYYTGDYYVSVTNQFGCQANSAPFHVTVNPNPNTPVVAVNQAGPYCEGSIYTLYISNPQVGITYVWSTGQIGDTIKVREAGAYSVTAFNVNGCSVESNVFTISEVPDVSTVMVGCYEICKSDFPITIPGPVGYARYEWYLGTTLFSTSQDLVAREFGVYYLVLTNLAGCSSTSGEIIITRLPSAEVDLSATIDCCEDKVICAGQSATIPIHFSGTGPYTFSYTDGTSTYTVTTSNSVYNLVVTPTKTSTYKILTVTSANESGCFEVCGQATVVVKDCSALTQAEKKKGITKDCSINCFSAKITNVVNTDGCKAITMNVTCVSTCQSALSDMTISVQCGTVSNMSNSLGYPMSITASDPNTGVSGIKIDNTNDICGSGLTINYTLCPNDYNCSFNICDPVVAFKSGTCVNYGTAAVPSTFKSIASGEATLEAGGVEMRVYPNPFSDNMLIDLNLDKNTEVQIEVYDMMGKKLTEIYNGELAAGQSQFNWDVTKAGENVPGGVYYIRTSLNGVVNHTKIMHTK